VGPDRQKCRRAARSDNGLLRQRASCGSKRDESTRAAGSNLRRARKNPRSAVGRRRKREGKTCVVRPGCAMLDTGSGTPREEGAIWRMTRSGRRSLSEGARVAWVARERDDTGGESPAACVPAGEVSRKVTERHRTWRIGFPDLTCTCDRRRSGRSNRSSTRRHGRNGAHWAHAPRERRIRLERS
jgi:hypothetical protein